MTIIDEISEAKRLWIDAGREPVVLLIHPKKHVELIRECEANPALADSFGRLLELKVILTTKIPDFLVIPKISWSEMTYK